MWSPWSEDIPRDTVTIPKRNIVEPKNTDEDKSPRSNGSIFKL